MAATAVSKIDFLTTIPFDSPSAIERALTDPVIARQVTDIMQSRYATINVAQIMEQLTLVGKLLQGAYAGSKGFDSCAPIAGVLLDYQVLIKHASVACTTFERSSIAALKMHATAKRTALKVEPSELHKPLKYLGQCAALAKKMSEAALELAGEAGNLGLQSKAAIQQVLNDQKITGEQKKAVNDRLIEFEAKQAQLKSLNDDLAKQIEEIQKSEREAAKLAEGASTGAFLLSTLSFGIAGGMTGGIPGAAIGVGIGIIGGILESSGGGDGKGSEGLASSVVEKAFHALTDNQQSMKRIEEQLAKDQAQLEQAKGNPQDLDKVPKLAQQIEEVQKQLNDKRKAVEASTAFLKDAQKVQSERANQLEQLRRLAVQQKADLESKRREIKGDLAATLTRISMTRADGNFLQQSVASLELAAKSLGQTHTTFLNTHKFWKNIEGHCNELENIGEAKLAVDCNFKDEFLDSLQQSALSWLALANINYIANQSLTIVDAGVDAIVSNLPSLEETSALIDEAQKLLDS